MDVVCVFAHNDEVESKQTDITEDIAITKIRSTKPIQLETGRLLIKIQIHKVVF